jgi:hypothetical protein
MVARARGQRHRRRHPRRAQAAALLLGSGDTIPFADYHTVFCSIDLDALWGRTAPHTGRMMIRCSFPVWRRRSEGAESPHYSSCEFQTRDGDEVITRHVAPAR